MKKNLLLLLALITLPLLLGAQTKQPGTAQTKGALSVTVFNTAAPSHSVALTCTPPTTGTTPTGYYFYRGTTPGGESTTPLNATEIGSCAYTDTTVLGNMTYYYTAKSNCSTCSPPSTSGPSNEVQANVPADAAPNPPTGLTTGTVSKNSVPLFWQTPAVQANYKIVTYRVYRGIKPAMPNPNLIATVNSSLLTYVDTKCSVGKTCYYYVKAYDRNLTLATYQLSVASNVVSAVGQ